MESFQSKVEKTVKKLVKILLATVIAATITTGAYAVFLSNFIVPSTVTITGAPGMSVNDVTKGGTLTALTWGDVQQTTSRTHQISIVNTGLTNIWIVDSTTPGVESLTTNPGLPNGVTLTWDFSSKLGTAACPGTPTVTGCLMLTPGTTSTILTLQLSAARTGALGSVSFQTVFAAYSTASG
ncbi:MAG TPA: hypothetical protein VFE98_10995 [Candidatus Bathyarchaeia archaeon]|nr:hypothetical protein [Candidatus Bathyarchaeia archaeon]